MPEHISCQLLVPIGYSDETPKPIKVNEAGNVFYDQWGEVGTEM